MDAITIFGTALLAFILGMHTYHGKSSTIQQARKALVECEATHGQKCTLVITAEISNGK